jgi:hypothetical protein
VSLVGFKRLGYPSTAGGPPSESSCGQAFLSEPEAGAVVYQHADSIAAPIAEHKQASRERVVGQLLTAQLGKGIDTLASVDRFDGHQDAHLRGNLQHCLPSKVPDDGGQTSRGQ